MTTKHNLKRIVRNYIQTRNLTEFCREMKKNGILQRSEMYDLIAKYYGRYYLKRLNTSYYELTCGVLQTDLDEKRPYYEPYYMNLLDECRMYKNAGTHKKVLIEGKTHIYWASPVYLHQDYNKSIWRDNTEENRRKMQIINAFLNKEKTFKKVEETIKYAGKEYPARTVKGKDEDLLIGTLKLYDDLHPGEFGSVNDGFASEEAVSIDEKVFYYVDENEINLPEEKLIEVLKESNPDWFN